MKKSWITILVFLNINSLSAASLMNVVHDVLQYNTDYLSARASSALVKDSLAIAKSNWMPQLSVNASKGQTITRPNPNPQGADPSKQKLESTAYGLTLNQKLLDMPSWLSLKKQSYQVQQAIYQEYYTRQSVMYQAAVQYFAVLQALGSYENELTKTKSYKEQLRQVKQEYEAGKAAQPTLAQVESQYLLAKAELLSARNNIIYEVQKLSQMTGRNYNYVQTLGSKMPLAVPMPNKVDFWINLMKKQNVSLKSKYASLSAARQAVEAARASAAPTMNFSAGASRSRPITFATEDFGKINTWSLSFNWPIVTGGRVAAVLSQSLHAQQQAEQAQIASERDLRQQTISSFYDIRVGIEQVKAASQAVHSANIAMMALKDGYLAGTQTISDVLQSISRLHAARLQLIKARYGYLGEVLRLKLITGVLSEKDFIATSKLLTKKHPVGTYS